MCADPPAAELPRRQGGTPHVPTITLIMVDMASQDFTESIIRLEGGYVALLDDGSTFVSFVLPPSDIDDERHSSLSERLRELADNFSVNSI